MLDIRRLAMRTYAVLATVTAVATVQGCASETKDTLNAPSGRAVVTIDEYRFSPNEIVTRPGQLDLQVKNRGALAHNLIVLKGKERFLVARTPTFQKGSQPLSLRVRQGTYVFVSNVGKDRELGLRGVIRVR